MPALILLHIRPSIKGKVAGRQQPQAAHQTHHRTLLLGHPHSSSHPQDPLSLHPPHIHSGLAGGYRTRRGLWANDRNTNVYRTGAGSTAFSAIIWDLSRCASATGVLCSCSLLLAALFCRPLCGRSLATRSCIHSISCSVRYPATVSSNLTGQRSKLSKTLARKVPHSLTRCTRIRTFGLHVSHSRGLYTTSTCHSHILPKQDPGVGFLCSRWESRRPQTPTTSGGCTALPCLSQPCYRDGCLVLPYTPGWGTLAAQRRDKEESQSHALITV